VSRRILLASLALLAPWLMAGCSPHAWSAIDPRWRPEAAVQSAAAHDCGLAARPLDDDTGAEIEACIAALSDDDVAVPVYDRPDGRLLFRILARGRNGEPVEIHDERKGHFLVMDHLGHRGWVRERDVPLIRLE